MFGDTEAERAKNLNMEIPIQSQQLVYYINSQLTHLSPIL